MEDYRAHQGDAEDQAAAGRCHHSRTTAPQTVDGKKGH
jgi:hypothetical protein